MALTLDPQALISQINWQQPSWDIFGILFFVIASFIYGLSLGRDRIILNIISIYISLAITERVPFLLLRPFANIPENQHFIVQIAIFIFILMVLFFLFSRSAFFSSSLRIESATWWHVLLLSIFQVGLLISVSLSFLPSEILQGASPLTQQLFGSGNAQSFWLISAILVSVITRESRESNLSRYP